MLSDTSAGMNFSNQSNEAISERNRAAISSARQLTALNQQGADAAALGKQQSDNVSDYVGDARDTFSGVLAGKYLNDEVLKGIYEAGSGEFSLAGAQTYLRGETDKLLRRKTGQGLDSVVGTLTTARDKVIGAPTPAVESPASEVRPTDPPAPAEPERDATASTEAVVSGPDEPASVGATADDVTDRLFAGGMVGLDDTAKRGTIVGTQANVLLDNDDPNLAGMGAVRQQKMMDPDDFQKVMDQYPGKTVIRSENGMWVHDTVYEGRVPAPAGSLMSGYSPAAGEAVSGIVAQRVQAIEGPAPPSPSPAAAGPPGEAAASETPEPARAPAEPASAEPGRAADQAPSDPVGSAGSSDPAEIEGAGAGKYVGYGLKIAGAVPGAIDAFSDLTNTDNGKWAPQLSGNNWQEKASNALAIGSTVLDFVPGLEWAGAVGNLASAGLGAWGDTKDQENLKNKDAAVTVKAVQPDLQAGLNFHAMGMVANQSNNAMSMIHSASSF